MTTKIISLLEELEALSATAREHHAAGNCVGTHETARRMQDVVATLRQEALYALWVQEGTTPLRGAL
jgi:hypothetical protein